MDALEVLVEQAQAAALRGEWELAVEAWSTVRGHFPDDPVGYIAGAVALRRTEQDGEADALLLLGARRLPQESGLAVQYGWSLMRRGDWAAAAEHWEAVRRDFPDLFAGYLEGVTLLWETREIEAIEALVSAAVKKFPRSPLLRLHHSWSAMARGDWAEAARRWTTMRDQYPNTILPYLDGAQALWYSEAHDQADEVLSVGVRKFPENLELARQYARAAANRWAWPEALRRWRTFQTNFPDDPEGETGAQDAETQSKLAGAGNEVEVGHCALIQTPTSGTSVALPAEAAHATQPPEVVLSRFESLGDTCEFGFVQRHFGAEPISLLRWGYVGLDMLLEGLASGLEGVGEEKFTELKINPIGGELLGGDTRFFNSVHTHVYHGTVDETAFLADFRSRLKLLRRKFLEDLSAGEKIFVCRRKQRLSDAEIMSVHEALERYGRNHLLCIRDSTPTHPSTTIERLSDRVLVGYLNLATRPLIDPISYDAWLSVCRQALSQAALP